MFKTPADEQNADQIVSFFEKESLTLLLTPQAEVDYGFVTSIDTQPENLLVDKYQIEGEFTLFGRIKRIYSAEQSVDLFKYLPGKLTIAMDDPKNPFRKFIKAMEALPKQGIGFGIDLDTLNGSSYEIEGPLFELSCLAIYANA